MRNEGCGGNAIKRSIMLLRASGETALMSISIAPSSIPFGVLPDEELI